MSDIHIDNFGGYTIAIIVFFIGKHLNSRYKFLRFYNIPEPVTGGLLAATFTWLLYLLGVEISFDLANRDLLLVYFFTAIGLNAKVSDLFNGGRPLVTLLILTIVFIIIQNIVGIFGASMLHIAPELGLLAGSASLIGGHGTAIAWAPEFVKQGINNALEVGVASATLGLVISSLIGGPIAQLLIARNKLKGEKCKKAENIVTVTHKARKESIEYTSIMAVILTLHIAIFCGWWLNELLASCGFKLPVFVTCLFSGILLSNTVPKLFPNVFWPARTKSLALMSDLSLGLFLTMSLMSMQLWNIIDLAGPLLIILTIQTITAVIFILGVLFRVMGYDYQAAVLCAGFGGFAMGATPTAIANMNAVTKTHGQAPLAFIILPLVAAFFVDISNSFILQIVLDLLK